MTKCTHTEACEECFEANRKLKAEVAIKSGLVGELRDLLGVSHLKGQRQLEAAVAEVKRLREIAKTVATVVEPSFEPNPPATREQIKEGVAKYFADRSG